jgi:hypothetical protein
MPFGSGEGDRFDRTSFKFIFKGLNVARPANMIEPGQYAYVKNIRSYIEGKLETRPGLTSLSSGYTALHSITRLNDLPVNDWTYIVGDGTTIKFGKTVLINADTGYSGLPFTCIEARPERSPSPLLYYTEGSKLRKIDVAGNVRNWGIFPPTAPPVVELSPAEVTSITDCTSSNPEAVAENGNVWNKSVNAISMTQVNRTNTTIASILYDSGSTGYCNIVPTAMGTDIQPGQRILVDGAEYVVVEQVFAAIADTTIAGIAYVSGATGECVIQLSTPVTGLVTNTLVRINAAETVRVLSVTNGPDGLPCFRCVTSGSFNVGDSVTGFQNFRCYTTGTYATTDTLVTKAYNFEVDPDSTTPTGIGQVRHNIELDLSSAGGRPITDDDEINIGIYLEDISRLIEGRIFIDVDEGTTSSYTATDVSRNYYFYPFRAADLQRYAVPTDPTTQQQAGQSIIQARQIDQFNEGPLRTIRDPISGAVVSYDQFIRDRQKIEQGLPGGIFGGIRRKLLNRYNEALGNVGQGGGLLTGPVLETGEFQAGSGQEQWYQLRVKVGDLIRVGTDSSRSLKDSTSFMVQFNLSGTTATDCRFSSVWIGGTYGPDSETDSDLLGNAYYYRYVARNSSTGETSLPSPPTRAGVIGRRQQRTVTFNTVSDAQVDKLDLYRYGGTILQWVYIATVDNTGTPTFVDNLADESITSNPLLSFENFPPVPTADSPKSGTCNVVGTRVEITAGDTLDVNYAPGTEFIINGKTFLFYAQPESTTTVELTESAGALTDAQFEIPNPIIMGNTLPTVFGPYGQGSGGLFYFFVGDTINPGVLYWTNGNDPNSCSDLNYLEITGPGEPLIGGIIYDGRPYVFSSEKMYLVSQNLSPQPGESQFFAQEIANSKGAWTRRGIACDTLIYFVGKDGIYESEGGQPRSITDDVLFPLFPHDGQPGTASAIGGIPPPDYTNPNSFSLTADGQYVRFVYQDSLSNWNMLIWEKRYRRWMYDDYGDGGVRVIFPDESLAAFATPYRLIAGTANGNFCVQTGTLDVTEAIPFRVITIAHDFGDTRAKKRLGDIMLDAAGGFIGIPVSVYLDNFSSLLVTTNVLAPARSIQIIDLNSGDEVFAVNVGLDIQYPGTGGARLELYEWQPSAVMKPVDTFLRATDWELSGGLGAKFLQGLLIEADTFGSDRQIRVESADGGVIETLTINHSRQMVKAYSLANPAIGSSFRLWPEDNFDDWRLFNVAWIFEPAPELVTVWETQGTTDDICGWATTREAYITVMSTDTVTLTINYDGVDVEYEIPSTAGAQEKIYLPLQAIKSKIRSYRLSSPTPFRLFKKDCCVMLAGWGRNTEMTVNKPFGGPSREDGAAI